eukprot:344589-Prorocentrum_minimum.AAC.1
MVVVALWFNRTAETPPGAPLVALPRALQSELALHLEGLVISAGDLHSIQMQWDKQASAERRNGVRMVVEGFVCALAVTGTGGPVTTDRVILTQDHTNITSHQMMT